MPKIFATISLTTTFCLISLSPALAQLRVAPVSFSTTNFVDQSLVPSGVYGVAVGLANASSQVFAMNNRNNANFTAASGDVDVIGTFIPDGSDVLATEVHVINGNGSCSLTISITNSNGSDLAPSGLVDSNGNTLDKAAITFGTNAGLSPLNFSAPVTSEISFMLGALPGLGTANLLVQGISYTSGSFGVTFNSGTTGLGITQYLLEYTYTSTDCVLLPVELLNFESTVTNGNVSLNWNTASEKENAGFNIEHSIDGENFSSLGFVDGFGTTTEEQTYSYTASDLDQGRHFFRLKQLDFNGTISYSEIIEARIDLLGTHELSALYPNPMLENGKMNLVVSENQNVDIAIYDLQGRRVADIANGVFNANTISEIDLDLSSLHSGVYFVVVQGRNFQESRPILLNK